MIGLELAEIGVKPHEPGPRAQQHAHFLVQFARQRRKGRLRTLDAAARQIPAGNIAVPDKQHPPSLVADEPAHAHGERTADAPVKTGGRAEPPPDEGRKLRHGAEPSMKPLPGAPFWHA